MSLAIPFVIGPAADAASTGFTGRMDVGVLGRIFMSARTMRDGCGIGFSHKFAIPACDILFMGDGLKVGRVNTRGLAAKMIKFMFGRDDPRRQLIGIPMRVNQPDSIPENAIAERGFGTLPKPTSIGLSYFRPKSLLHGGRRTSETARGTIMLHAIIIAGFHRVS